MTKKIELLARGKALPNRERARRGNLHENKLGTRIPNLGKMLAQTIIPTLLYQIMQIIHLAEFFPIDKQLVQELTELTARCREGMQYRAFSHNASRHFLN